MYPEINIGPLTLQTFGLMFGLGFVAAGLIVGRRFKELGKPGTGPTRWPSRRWSAGSSAPASTS